MIFKKYNGYFSLSRCSETISDDGSASIQFNNTSNSGARSCSEFGDYRYECPECLKTFVKKIYHLYLMN